jgi:hypothetical protein
MFESKIIKGDSHIYMEHGWDDFAEDINIEEGDTLFFSYTGVFNEGSHYGSNGCEKITSHVT